MANKKFKIEDLYQKYLQLVSLKEANMHPEQKHQLRQTFFGACGQLLLLLRDEVGELSEEDGAAAFQDMLSQVNDYFQATANRRN